MSVRVEVQPELLAWARARSGIDDKTWATRFPPLRRLARRPGPDAGRRRTKTPNAVAENGVRHMNPFQMLRAEGARFVLDP